MPLYIVLAALAVTLSVPVLWLSLTGDRAPVSQVARNLNAGVVDGGNLRRLVLSQSPLERILQPALRSASRASRRLTPSGVVTALERRIELSGVAWTLEQVLIVKVVAGGGLMAAGLLWASVSGSSMAFLAVVAGAVVGYLGPDTVLARKASARQLTISNELPDTLDQLTICVEAGLGFDAALARVARSGEGPLAVEIARVLQELRLGVPRVEALNNLLARTDVPELRQFVHDVIHAATYGVPISRVLRTQATEQREKRRFRAEERAMKLPVKVIFPLVFCILPSLFLVILGPAYIQIKTGFK